MVLFERGRFGDGSSGHTGGMVLAESAVGDLPGLGDVLEGYQEILTDLEVESELTLPGVHEIAHGPANKKSTIRWKDPGDLSVVNTVPGGSVNPGKVVDGLAAAAERLGVLLFEDCPIASVDFLLGGVRLKTAADAQGCETGKALFACNAYSSELIGLQNRVESPFTMAVLTEELAEATIQEIGLGDGRPFYTVDLPYLWGRLLGSQILFGSGLVDLKNWSELDTLDIESGRAAEILGKLRQRIRGLHPALKDVRFTHQWGGPICIAEDWAPIFEYHAQSRGAVVLGAFSGHGVAQSVYLGKWAAQALLVQRELPNWRDKK